MAAERERIVEEVSETILINVGRQIIKKVEEVLDKMNFDAFMDDDDDISDELLKRIRCRIYVDYGAEDEDDS